MRAHVDGKVLPPYAVDRRLLPGQPAPAEGLTVGAAVTGGVLSRFPRLRMAFLEGNCARFYELSPP